MDLKKEIKLSDLFKRKPKEAKPQAAEAVAAEPKAEKKSGLKREISFSFKRRPKDPDFDSGPAKPKRERRKRAPKGGGDEKKGAAVPQIPLMRAFNLMPDDVAGPQAGRRPNRIQLVMAVVGLLLLAGLASMFLIGNAQVADKEQEVAALEQELQQKQQPIEEPGAGNETDAALIQERDGRTGALSSALGHRVGWDRLLRDVSLILPEDVWLTTLTGTSAPPPASDPTAPPDPNAGETTQSTVQITGYTRRHEGVARFLSRLQVLPEVESASLVTAATTEIGEQKVVQFTLAAIVKPHQAGGAA